MYTANNTVALENATYADKEMNIMYPRIRMEGSVYYITTIVYGRLKIFNTPSFTIPILDSLNFYRHQFKCKLLGYVIMLDHLHLLIYPTGDSSVVSDFMRDFKRFTSGRIGRQNRMDGSFSRVRRRDETSREKSLAGFILGAVHLYRKVPD